VSQSVEDSLRRGDLAEALARAQSEVRQQPADRRLRMTLAQILLAQGQWDRALIQLKVLGEMDASTLSTVYAYRGAVGAEQVRSAVFAGFQTPMVFGEPQQWVALLIQALSEEAKGRSASAKSLRSEAHDSAEPTPGSLDGQPFAWLADADHRLGRVLEVILEGRYYWVPVQRIGHISLGGPQDLQDLVWIPANLTWANGGQMQGLLPTRYPGTVGVSDDALKLCRKTDWVTVGADQTEGLGQRLLATDVDDYPLLDIREIAFEHRVT
jgi:type VI secretion system protein ImpE